jgi:isocitrate lyase
MRADMAAYDADRQVHPVAGLLARFHRPAEDDLHQKHFNSTDRRYLYLSGWMVAALRSSSARCRTSRCTKTAVSA